MTNENKDSLHKTNQNLDAKTEVHSDSHQEAGEILNFDNPDYSFIPKGYHEWRQRGPYCVCVSCELEHAVYIGMDKVLIGIEDVQPVVRKKF